MSVGHCDHVLTVYSSISKSRAPYLSTLGNILQLCKVRSFYNAVCVVDMQWSYTRLKCIRDHWKMPRQTPMFILTFVLTMVILADER